MAKHFTEYMPAARQQELRKLADQLGVKPTVLGAAVVALDALRELPAADRSTAVSVIIALHQKGTLYG